MEARIEEYKKDHLRQLEMHQDEAYERDLNIDELEKALHQKEIALEIKEEEIAELRS